MGYAMVTQGQQEKIQMSMDRLFGISHHLKTEPGPKGFMRVTQGAPLEIDLGFKSLQEAYVNCSGDYDLRMFGKRATQIFNDASFESIVANSLNKLLLRDFATNYRWQDIVSSITRVDNFHPANRPRVRYVADLPDIGDDGVYEEADVSGDEQVTYSVTQRGARLTITRRALINDDVGGITRTVEQLGRAAFRTLAKRVWNKVIENDPYSVDGLDMFHADHGNLGSAGLSPAALTAARAAIFAQTEPGSNERLGLSGPFLLVIPIELEPVALPINTSMVAPGTATDPNPWYERFGENSERIFTNPLCADANDWYLFDVSGNAGIIEVGFLMGKQTPEMILANAERVGEMMDQDRIIYKIRHEFEACILDYRAAYKAVVS